MEDKNNKFKVRLINHQMSGDVPQYSEKVNKTKGLVSYGDDNLYPDFLLGLLARSSTHRAIVKTKSQLIGGNGINKQGLSNEALKFISNPWNEYDLEEIVARISLDLEIYGAFALNIIWTKDRTRIAEINYINPQTLRIKEPDPDSPTTQEYIINKNWKKYEVKNSVVYPGFSRVNIKNPSQILYVKEYQAGRYFYGEPSYVSNVKSIMCDYSIANYHYNNIENGFALSTLINFVGNVPIDEEIDMELARLDQQFRGSNNAGGPMVTFSQTKDEAPIVTVMDSQKNGENFIKLDETIVSKIMTAHQVVSPNLFGIPTPGALSSKNEMIQAMKLLQAQYITPKQNLIEKTLNRLARINGITENITLSKYELDVEVDVSIADLLSVLTANITPAQKMAVLVAAGYSEDEAKSIVGDGKEPEPTAPLTPPAPDKKAVKVAQREAFLKFRDQERDEVEKIRQKLNKEI